MYKVTGALGTSCNFLNKFGKVDDLIDICYIFVSAWNETSQHFNAPPPSVHLRLKFTHLWVHDNFIEKKFYPSSVRALGYFRDSSFGHFRDFFGVETENRALFLKNRFLLLKTVIFTDFSVSDLGYNRGHLEPTINFYCHIEKNKFIVLKNTNLSRLGGIP